MIVIQIQFKNIFHQKVHSIILIQSPRRFSAKAVFFRHGGFPPQRFFRHGGFLPHRFFFPPRRFSATAVFFRHSDFSAAAVLFRHSDFSAAAVFRHSDFFSATAIFPPQRIFFPPWRISATADCSRGGFPPQGEIFPLRSASGRKFSVRHAPLRSGKNFKNLHPWLQG